MTPLASSILTIGSNGAKFLDGDPKPEMEVVCRILLAHRS